jgi:hypothetical protein
MSGIEACKAPFGLSVLTATQGHASKRLVPDVQGRPIKDPAHHLGISAGRMEHVSVQGLLGLQELLSGIKHNQALVHGIPKESTPGSVYCLVLAEQFSGAPGTIARTLDCLGYPAGVRLIMLDYDPEPEAPHRLTSAGELITRLSTIWPAFSEVGWLATTSTSSAIKAKKTHQWLRPPDGMHVYLLVTGDVIRWRDIATVKLWLAEEGYCKLALANRHTGVASILMRALIDLTVFSPERLDYVAGAEIKRAPFYQDRPAPELQSGLVLDLDRLPDVTEDERQAASAMMSQHRQRIAPEQRRLVREQIMREPVVVDNVEDEVNTRLERAERGELAADHLLYFDNGSTCTAGTLTAAHDKKRLSDPLEPDYGPNQAGCHWRKGDWRIVSWAHGVKRVFCLITRESSTSPLDDDDMNDLLKRTDQDAMDAWQEQLSTTNGGVVQETLGNVMLALQHLEPWASACWYDEVRDLLMVGNRELDNMMVTRAGLDLEAQVKMPIRSKHLVPTALTYLCHQRPRDLLREWLDNLPAWDETPRLHTWLQTYANAPDNAYGRDVSRLLVEGMVARALNPGCQYRHVPILEGLENSGKTKLVRELATPEWYRELSHGLEGKEAHMRLKRAWVAELAELSSISKTEESRLKSFFTLNEDAYIPKFSNFEVVHKRRTVFIGTVNPEGDNTYLRGQTGNTRYLPIPVRDINVEGFKQVREQLFAEALHHHRDHPDDWWKLSSNGEATAEEVREDRRQRSVYEDVLGSWLERTGKKMTWWEEIASDYLSLPLEKWADRRIQMEVAKALKALGWEKDKRERLPSGVRVVPWRPGSDWRLEP